jgi:hypothetical protein
LRKSLALAAALAVLCAARPADARGAKQENVPFVLSSLGTPFGVQVKVEGTYTVYDTYVEVNVGRALIRVSEHCPYRGRRLVTTVLVGLATKARGGGWQVENRSLPVYVEQVLSPTEEYALADLSFRIPRSANTDLAQRWLVFETEELDIDAPDGEREVKGYAFAHSRRDIFAVSAEGR